MSEDANWLVHDHRKYDAALDECELAAGAQEWKAAIALFKEFVKDLELHMRMEDEVLYPLFAQETGDPEGEIELLTDEHENIARLLQDLAIIIKTKNFDHFEDSLHPLHRIMNEHNVHEEAAFRRLGSDSLLMRRDEIMARLKAV